MSGALPPRGEQCQEVVDAHAAAIVVAGRADLPPLGKQLEEVVDAHGPVVVPAVAGQAAGPLCRSWMCVSKFLYKFL